MYNNYSTYSYIENKQVQRIYHRLFGSKPKEKRKEYTIQNTIQNKSSNNKELTNQLSGGKQKRKGDVIQLYREYIQKITYIEREKKKHYINTYIENTIKRIQLYI